jgi:hypothetical protein
LVIEDDVVGGYVKHVNTSPKDKKLPKIPDYVKKLTKWPKFFEKCQKLTCYRGQYLASRGGRGCVEHVDTNPKGKKLPKIPDFVKKLTKWPLFF